ncbi:MAG: hypothetical protein EZS26_000594 [Candidatus Ordinivivax streblomastigis]|uniref:Uncharacterized protein n=1 Tax=Candidatus Ordinivivax streblomastigis TaxID=2540710 RepID=A0A5M8P4Y0_9BACT|nr:MAG: hypothetical protein EZS26_000373 [Candidatus Ordinivivax streblomastigis]KAA6303434.1 MAG: hypothetical protein EZS26_000594 [Candidatus Ordinivivax streblomastigis]
MISLGGYGGYVVFGFDHLVENRAGKYDFKVLANAFYANANPNMGASREGGSCEPGIVMVSYDANNNGIPDDEWYELAGSEYHKPETTHHYEITYHKPDAGKTPTPDYSYPFLNDTTYIRWTTNGHGNGYLYRNTFHSQPYYPQWIADETIVFEGTKLADNYVDESGVGNYYVQYAYAWGYVDNHPNNDHRSGFSIEWAVDGDGNPVQLPGIHFVKVYLTGGDVDVPTDLTGFENLLGFDRQESVALLQNPVQQALLIASAHSQQADVYNLMGNKVMSFTLGSGTNHINCNLSQGLYVLVTDNQAIPIYQVLWIPPTC